ncbi:MAG: hypothetical protein IMZ50_16400 [Candidatus Atribacteria bacterium]|nr:hypothetical protein [Candidatus Atribacteria bacterium]
MAEKAQLTKDDVLASLSKECAELMSRIQGFADLPCFMGTDTKREIMRAAICLEYATGHLKRANSERRQ